MVEETSLNGIQHAQPGLRRRVLLVDDHIMLRQGLSLLLSSEPDLEIVGEASDGLEGVEQTRRLQPDVVVLDFSMPRMDGIQAARIIRSEFPEMRIIGLSMYSKDDRAQAMIEAGADAYVEKNGQAENLLAAIRG